MRLYCIISWSSYKAVNTSPYRTFRNFFRNKPDTFSFEGKYKIETSPFTKHVMYTPLRVGVPVKCWSHSLGDLETNGAYGNDLRPTALHSVLTITRDVGTHVGSNTCERILKPVASHIHITPCIFPAQDMSIASATSNI